ncbi:hypothetical protein QTG54_004037 [Skeletonema marinoi]|uniref:8-amino-7-oxononanoate synthase n=1 Tax=Skeletonema marinoi TaxID=267567 RepID=A0AAD9DEI9_9STRA|nr:hypothetical protein QTG54_004037 [Skeletonema marinoi]
MESRLQECLDRREREGTLRSLMPIPTSSASSASTSTFPVIDFSSNDYLGFARCPEQHHRVESSYKQFMSTTYSHAQGLCWEPLEVAYSLETPILLDRWKRILLIFTIDRQHCFQFRI